MGEPTRQQTIQQSHLAQSPSGSTADPELGAAAAQKRDSGPQVGDDLFGDICTPERGVKLSCRF
jgi:hypothetical protein